MTRSQNLKQRVDDSWSVSTRQPAVEMNWSSTACAALRWMLFNKFGDSRDLRLVAGWHHMLAAMRGIKLHAKICMVIF